MSTCNTGDPSLIPGSGRSPGEGNGSPLQYSCLENSMDGGAWWATVHGVAKSRTWQWFDFVKTLDHYWFSQYSTKSIVKISKNSLWFSSVPLTEEATQPCLNPKCSLILDCSGLTFSDYTGVSMLIEVFVQLVFGLILSLLFRNGVFTDSLSLLRSWPYSSHPFSPKDTDFVPPATVDFFSDFMKFLAVRVSGGCKGSRVGIHVGHEFLHFQLTTNYFWTLTFDYPNIIWEYVFEM